MERNGGKKRRIEEEEEKGRGGEKRYREVKESRGNEKKWKVEVVRIREKWKRKKEERRRGDKVVCPTWESYTL